MVLKGSWGLQLTRFNSMYSMFQVFLSLQMIKESSLKLVTLFLIISIFNLFGYIFI